jgi:phage protein D
MMTKKNIREPYFEITVGDTLLSMEDLFRIDSIKIEDTKEDADKCDFTVADVNYEYVDIYTEEKPIRVIVGYLVGDKYVFIGKISTVTVKYPEDGVPRLQVSCTSRVKELMDTQENTLWENITASQLAQKIADKYGLKADIDETTVLFPYVSQTGITDAALLRKLSRKSNRIFKVRGNVLAFYKEKPTAESAKVFYYREEDHSIKNCEIKYKTETKARGVGGANLNNMEGTPVEGEAEGADTAGSENVVDSIMDSLTREDLTSPEIYDPESGEFFFP